MKCTIVSTQVYEPGVSYDLALKRKDCIESLKYNLSFSIPDSVNGPITGSIKIKFGYKNTENDLILDFQNEQANVLSVLVNGESDTYRIENKHIIIPASSLQEGSNEIKIDFIAGDASLNRQADYLYTLFVPDKASIAFPCFDQPDLKANFSLNLKVPEHWQAVSNGSVLSEKIHGGTKEFQFSETALISTYHFAFVAGQFQKLTKTKNGRTINFYHREDDSVKVKSSEETVFDMHFLAIDWMENYTGIKYPFEKLDFIAIPSFQFSGMEHVGAIYYRDSRLFLSKSASIDDILKRATVITHEVSHMWFGDLVTMKWFDDVWLKEVYAELLAAKMVGPLFPDMNHDLNFITSNYPRAYQTDRTAGTHPIKQQLENLNFAGTLYGDIIYYKAPIVMAKLERIAGEKALQNGLKEYLKTYEFSNASWDDLIKILNKYTEVDLNDWSRDWVEQDGMSMISSEVSYDGNGKITYFLLKQEDIFNRGRTWKQNLEILWCKNGQYRKVPVYLEKKEMEVDGIVGLEKPDFFLLNGGGYGYGYFELDSASQQFLLKHVHELDDELIRTISYITLFQALVNYHLDPKEYISEMVSSLKHENIKQNIQLILENFEKSWWFFLKDQERGEMCDLVEKNLLQLIKDEKDIEIKSTVFQTLLSVFISKSTQDLLYGLWKNEEKIYGLTLSETDFSTIALELSLRDYPNADAILKMQLSRINDKERNEKMRFIMPSVSIDESKRDKFFESLMNPENRQHEIWVRTGLYYLNHPLRAKYSVKYLQKSLEMLEEIQQTGDIFFPKNWLAYSVGRYNSAEAAQIVSKFLNENPNYNQNLRSKILQLSDLLFRAERIIDKRYQYGKNPPDIKP